MATTLQNLRLTSLCLGGLALALLAVPAFSSGTGPCADSGGITDCNGNGVEDAVDIAVGSSSDVNYNGVPDECEPG